MTAKQLADVLSPMSVPQMRSAIDMMFGLDMSDKATGNVVLYVIDHPRTHWFGITETHVIVHCVDQKNSRYAGDWRPINKQTFLEKLRELDLEVQ